MNQEAGINNIEKNVSKIKFIFDEKFNYKYRYKFYDFCVDLAANQRATLPLSVWNNIFGKDGGKNKENKNKNHDNTSNKPTNETKTCNLDDSTGDITLDEIIEDPKSVYRKLCLDPDKNNDSKNARLISMLSIEDDVKAAINHKTDKTISGLELVEACKNGQIEIVKAIVNCNADINARECGEYTNAKNGRGYCRTNPYEKRPGNKNSGSYQYYNPLTIACLYGHKPIVEYLVVNKKCKLDIYYSTNSVGDGQIFYDALHAACRKSNNPDIIHLLLSKKKDWNFDHLSAEHDCVEDMCIYAKSVKEALLETVKVELDH